MATAKKETKIKAVVTETIPQSEPVVIEEQIAETVTPEPEITEPTKEIIEPKIVTPINNTPIITEGMSDEEKLLAYIDSRPNGEVKLNDFLKSLFPIAKFNEPQVYLTQQSSKTIKNLLNKLNLTIVNNEHEKLGKFYYDGDKTETQYHNLTTVSIILKK